MPLAVDSANSLPTTQAPTIDPAIAALIADLKTDVGLVKAAFAGYKAGGTAGAIEAAAPAIAIVPGQFADVTKALPALKSGFTTSEGILTTGIAVVSAAVMAFEPNLPAWVVAVLGSASTIGVAVYTVVRGLSKNAHVAAVASVASAAASVPLSVAPKA